MAGKKETAKKSTGKTVASTKSKSDPIVEKLNSTEPLETETASDIESPEALAYRRGDIVSIGRGADAFDVTFKAFTSVYQAKGYKIVEKK